MADNDLIVVIPGITGSTLRRNGAEVWSSKPTTVLATLATLGRHIAQLQLPADIGDRAPDDGVEAKELISTLHFIPGLWTPVHGYEKLVDRPARSRLWGSGIVRRRGQSDALILRAATDSHHYGIFTNFQLLCRRFMLGCIAGSGRCAALRGRASSSDG